MGTYISLLRFTDQGIRTVKDTTKRAEAVAEGAKKFGASVPNSTGPWVATIWFPLSKHRMTSPQPRSASPSVRRGMFTRRLCELFPGTR